MLRNTASQNVGCQMNSRTDGSPLTTSVSVFVTKDGTRASGTGTLAHKGDGQWDYIPTQAETDATHVVFQFVHSTGVNQAINIYPLRFDQRKLGLNLTAMIEGTVDDTGFAPTTTEFETNITEATANHFGGQAGGNSRVIVWLTGALFGQASKISDYALVSGRGHFTVPAMTEAPADGDTFVIV